MVMRHCLCNNNLAITTSLLFERGATIGAGAVAASLEEIILMMIGRSCDGART